MIALLGALHAGLTLRVQSDNVRLVAEGLPFRRAFEELIEHLPVLNRSLIVLVESDSPSTARDIGDQLARAIADEPSVRDFYQPAGGPFFRRNALLYLDVEEVDDLVQRIGNSKLLLGPTSDIMSSRGDLWRIAALKRPTSAPISDDSEVEFDADCEAAFEAGG